MSATGRRSAPGRKRQSSGPSVARRRGKAGRATGRPPCPDSSCRDRLGLALAGGGFRAALFHVGVFRRLAELDLLRYVEVLSTVSGGSIVGALYVLLLKRELERTEGRNRLERWEYCGIVDKLEARLVAGIRKNLRARLFMNPLDLIHTLIAPRRSLGDRMAELYDRHIYAGTIGELARDCPDRPFRLQELLIRPGRREISEWPPGGDIDSYNSAQVQSGGSAVTKLVMNATSLNTGARFVFKATEFGEWNYGYVRCNEAPTLARLKCELEAILREPNERRVADIEDESKRSLARWVLTGVASHLPVAATGLLRDWPPPFDIASGRGRGAGLDALRTADLGLLRLARLAAWHLSNLMDRPDGSESGGFTAAQHRHDLAVTLGQITHNYATTVQKWLDNNEPKLRPLCDFINSVYLYRSARNVTTTIHTEAGQWRLSQAVAASANFPPIFPPLLVFGIYDDLTVSRLGLTDGGVYDNLGVVGLMNEGCNYIISSDTGLIEKPVQEVSQGLIGMMGRIVSITTDNGARHMRNLLVDRHQVSAGLELAYRAAGGGSDGLAHDIDLVHATRQLQGFVGMRIDSPAVVALESREQAGGAGLRIPAFDAAVVGSIRTDLDNFGDIEINALINQGYANAGLYVKQWLDFAARRNGRDERPPHARERYGPEGCDAYPYAAAQDSRYADARTQPLRPIADTASGNRPDRRADWAVRIGRYRIFRVFRFRWPLDAWFVGVWAAVLAGAATLYGQREWLAWVIPERRFPGFAINTVSILGAAAAVAAWFLVPQMLRCAVDAGIQRAEHAGNLRLARWLAKKRRLPARPSFWLAIATMLLFGAVFVLSGNDGTPAERLLAGINSVLIEAAIVIVLVFLLSLLAVFGWIDGWLAACSQRLNRTGRPSGGPKTGAE